MQTSISILPGDSRVTYLADYLSHKGGKLMNSYADIPEAGCVICGVPFTRDQKTLNTTLEPALAIDSFLGMLNSKHMLVGGGLPKQVTTYCTSHGIKYYDVLSSEELVTKNARLTAEGLLISLLCHTSFSISSFRTLLVGYGRCGREIADILSLFTDEIYICDISASARKAAESNHFTTVTSKMIVNHTHPVCSVNTVINTVPGNPFEDYTWRQFPADCTVFHIGSSDMTLPYPFTNSLIRCPGIPGKYAPKTAGTLIGKEICRHFKL